MEKTRSMAGAREWTIGTRGSPLALAQAEEFSRRLKEAGRGSRVTIRTFETSGDRMATALQPPSGPGTKGLFTRELEEALASGSIDFAVHSLKDLPTTLPEGLELAGVLVREDVRDVLVYRDADWVRRRGGPEEWSPGQKLMRGFKPGLRPMDLPADVVVGTSSPRRAAWVRRWVATAEVAPLRGNVGTRLARLSSNASLDAAVLAMAGLRRLGLFVGPGGRLARDPRRTSHSAVTVPEGLLATTLEPEEMLPAPGQGALGIEVATSNAAAADMARALTHRNTWVAVTAEREFLRILGDGCASPVSAHGRVLGHKVELRVAVESEGKWWGAVQSRASSDAAALGRDMAMEARTWQGRGS